ncbi:MAG: hypothetical protein SGARI_003679 [Bacillariaceae sp.]
MARLVTSKLNETFQAKSHAMELEKGRLEEAKCNAEARAMAAEDNDKEKEVKALNIKVSELTAEVDAVKKGRERMRIRLQKDAERKVAIEAKALADVTHQLHEEQDAKAEAMKVATAKSEAVKQKAEECDALNQQLATLRTEVATTKSAALLGLLNMQQDHAQKAEADALKIQQLVNALRQEEEGRHAATAEAIKKYAEAEKSAEEAATLRREIEILKTEAIKKARAAEKEAATLRTEIRILKAEAGKKAKEAELKRQDEATDQTAFSKECSPESGTQEESRGSKTSSKPSFKPKKGKKRSKTGKLPQKEKKSVGDETDSLERRFVFSDDSKGDADSKPNASEPRANSPPNMTGSQSKKDDIKLQYETWDQFSDEAFREQERLLNASKARMRSQHGQARVLPGHEKQKRVKSRSFAAPNQEVHIQYPEHWQYEDLYSRLGLPRSASDSMIKSQYRRLALQYHPDRNSHSEESKEKFQAVTEAYEALMHKH